ncbi:hypothetical protein JRQ81_018350 [Phrynocephalus forsythii]|uniref:Vipericidin n=1 Tax=Phrynocephalus forsythii TaxID=171643 RepID=A0A9Q0XNI0_9SAUR|nr:hypothetical protein JRQ81_018350 [Phrynocephalus forsythii]
MKSHWAALLVLGSMAAAGTPLLPALSYEEAVASAVELYNEVEDNEFAFQLLEAEPQPNWKPSAETAQLFKFSIKETICCSFENPGASRCNFKKDGVIKDCSGSYTFRKNPPAVQTKVLCKDI